MANFIYRAKTSTGSIVKGNYDAVDKNMVISLLRSKGFFPLEIKENTEAKRDIKLASIKKISSKDLAVFCRQFHTMLNAGVSILNCLEMIKRQSQNKGLSEIANRLSADVQKGMSLSEAMKLHEKVLPLILISLVEVGEISGSIDVIFDRLAANFTADSKVQQKIKTAMVYPSVIGCISVVMVIFMMIFIVPRFVKMFTTMGATLPLPTRMLLAISGAFTNIWFMCGLVLGIILIIYVFKRYRATPKGKFTIDKFLLKMPIIKGNIQKTVASRFTRSVSLMLRTGVSLEQALDVADKVINNQVVSKGLMNVKEEIKRGSNLSGPLEEVGVFPIIVTQMVSVGEESGSLDTVMETVADFCDSELDASISKLVALLEPLMIVCMALIIGFIVISMIMPMFGMYGAMKK